jgi:hypothetical protein
VRLEFIRRVHSRALLDARAVIPETRLTKSLMISPDDVKVPPSALLEISTMAVSDPRWPVFFSKQFLSFQFLRPFSGYIGFLSFLWMINRLEQKCRVKINAGRQKVFGPSKDSNQSEATTFETDCAERDALSRWPRLRFHLTCQKHNQGRFRRLSGTPASKSWIEL